MYCLQPVIYGNPESCPMQKTNPIGVQLLQKIYKHFNNGFHFCAQELLFYSHTGQHKFYVHKH